MTSISATLSASAVPFLTAKIAEKTRKVSVSFTTGIANGYGLLNLTCLEV